MDLKTKLKQKNISVKALASQLNLDRRAIYGYINGEYRPSKEIQEKIESLFNCKINFTSSSTLKIPKYNKYEKAIHKYKIKWKNVATALKKKPQNIRKVIEKGLLSPEEENNFNKLLEPYLKQEFYTSFLSKKEGLNITNASLASLLNVSEGRISQKTKSKNFSMQEIEKINSFLKRKLKELKNKGRKKC